MRWAMVVAFLLVAIGAFACGEAFDPYGVELQNSSALNALTGPAGFSTDPCNPIPDLPADFLGALPTCCGGKGHCIPEGAGLGNQGDQLPVCTEGGRCVPTSVLQASKAPPRACKSAGGKGVCFPTCIDQVDRLKLVLTQDICDPDERCVPCVNPSDGKATGLCEIGQAAKAAEKPASCKANVSKPAAALCADPPSVVDVKKLTACEAGHCIPRGAAGEDLVSQLAPCEDAAYVCAPDPFIATGGLFLPKTCASVNAAEGRCFSAAIGEVKEQGDRLPQDTCAKDERCTPCYDPISGDALPTCQTPCDAGPTKPKMMFATCGGERGRCVPETALGSGLLKIALKQDTCKKAERCAPLSAIKRDATPKACKTRGLFTSGAAGVCVEAVFSDLVGSLGGVVGVSKANCDETFLCVPCDLGDTPLKGCPAKAPTMTTATKK